MRNVLINTWVAGTIAVGTVSVSAGLTLATGETHWFARAGAILTIVGMLLLIKHSVLCAGMDLHEAMAEKLHYRRGRAPPTPGTARYAAELRHTRRILFDEFLGFGMTLTGTVIWAYGDLLAASLV